MNTTNISIFLDVALSLTFFYFVTSMFVSGIVEFINTAFENRSYFLWYSLEKLQTLQPKKWKAFQKEEVFAKTNNPVNPPVPPLDNLPQTWFEKFKNHAMIKNLESDKGKWRDTRVSYISADIFVSVIRDILSNLNSDLNSTKKTAKFQELNQLISLLENGDFRDILQTIANQSKSVKDFEDKLAIWYNQYMEQVSGWFKRHARLIVIGISLIVTICLNLNTINITQQLSSDKALRNSIIAMAEKTVKNSVDSTKSIDSTNIAKPDSIFATNFLKSDTTFKKFIFENYPDLMGKDSTIKITNEVAKFQYQEAVAKYLEGNIEDLGLNFGYAGSGFWENVKLAFMMIGDKPVNTIFGWLLTMAALSFGAPFWFDILIKLVNVRNVMKKPDGNK